MPATRPATVKTLVFDAKNLVMRSFHAYTKDLRNSAGDPTNLIHGSFLELFKHVKQFQPTRTILTWDSRSVFRKALYQGYKARPPGAGLSDEAFSSYNRQVRVFREGLEMLNILQYEHDGVEGDDLIALCTIRRENLPVVVVSTDHDFWQLIREGVSIYDPRTKSQLGLSGFTSVTGFDSPTHHLAWKCLKGDRGDGVPPVVSRIRETKVLDLARVLKLPVVLEKIQHVERLECPGLESDFGEALARNFKLVSLHAALFIQRDILSQLEPRRGKQNYEAFVKYCQKYELNMVAKAYGEVVSLV